MVLTQQRPGRESNLVSAIHKSDALPVSHRATQSSCRGRLREKESSVRKASGQDCSRTSPIWSLKWEGHSFRCICCYDALLFICECW